MLELVVESQKKKIFMSASITPVISALQQLRLKLLDLTGRNRLINFKHAPGKSLRFVEGHPSAIYQKLVEANNKANINVIGIPEPSQRDWVQRNNRAQRPDPSEWAKSVGISTSYDIVGAGEGSGESHVRALMYSDDLAKHCRKLEREARLAIEETGANMLFLVLGFLEFPDQPNSERTYTAPLIALPVSFEKREVAGSQRFSLQFTGDDISENLSLLEKLRNDFGMVLPEFPDEPIDVNVYFAKIQEVIAKQSGFVLKHHVSLCLLSFTNMLLFRDLDPTKWPKNGDSNSLIDHPIVRDIFEGRLDEGAAGFSFKEEHLVEEGAGASIPLVYDADSSQHSALIDVLVHKKNLVIEGAPGTGKSQTITNLIAACLREGKRVLFVAEKLAALEVVKSRLSQAGLDPFVLELHSNKTNKKLVLEEISRRITFRPTYPSDLPLLQQHLEAHRHDLKGYADLINSVAHNAFGLTLHQIMWRAEKSRQGISTQEGVLSQITIGDATQISDFELRKRLESLRHLGSQYEAIGGIDASCAFRGFYVEPLIPGDEVKLISLFEAVNCWGQQFIDATMHLSHVQGARINNLSLSFCVDQLVTLRRFLVQANHKLPLQLIPRFFKEDQDGLKTAQSFNEFAAHVDHFRRLEAPVKAALKLESSATAAGLAHLQALRQIGEIAGAEFGTLSELEKLHNRIVESIGKLSSANSALVGFFSAKSIPYDGSRQRLEQLLSFIDLVLEVPEEHLDIQTPGLSLDGAAQAIEQLLALQEEWTSLEKQLSDSLFVDTLPSAGEVKQAIKALREGPTWYRFFQGEWRRASRLYRTLQLNKSKVPSRKRLDELEKTLKLIQLKERWESSPTWSLFIGRPVAGVPMPLEGYFALATWNRRIRIASEDVMVVLIDPGIVTADYLRKLRRDFSTVRIEITTVLTVFKSIEEKFKRFSEFPEGHLIETKVEKIEQLAAALERHLGQLGRHVCSEATLTEAITGYEAALERSRLRERIRSNSQVKGLLGDFFSGEDTDCAAVNEALEFGQRIGELNLSQEIRRMLYSGDPRELARIAINALETIHFGLKSVQDLTLALCEFGKFDLLTWTGVSAEGDLEDFANAFLAAAKKVVRDKNLLVPWSQYLIRQKEAIKFSLARFVELLEKKFLKASELPDAYSYCVYGTITRDAFRCSPRLGSFTGLKHNQIRDEFKRLDKTIIALRGRAIAFECAKRAAPLVGKSGVRVDDRTEMVLLDYLMPQQRPRMPVRKILTRAGRSIQALKPCFMMGPQAVAQYLAPGVVKFDLVIMDEASQLRPEEAIGAIARGGQLVVVGDPKQLPPTSFFSRMNQSNDDDDQFTTTDAESILDVCSSNFRATRALRWHYRSQHHSLIAFSNHHFYRGNLVIFPSPYAQGGQLGVRAVYLADAIYENQTNLREAKRVVDAVVEHISTRPKDSLGIVTLNVKQRDLIAEILEERLKFAQGAEAYRGFWDGQGQSLFIKNLENVQGDERDAIIISMTFGKPPGSSAVRQNFGPISRQGGWRRLNVLFTRAKKSIAVYTSLRPEDILLDGMTPEGTKVLRNYLEYARTGSLTTSEATDREPDSDFEISVMDMLKQRGYDVTAQLGVAGYRIDIAVKHPDGPGWYLAAIECDGASYHSASSVRDRDRIRQEILESLGWRGRIWRIWSTDWFRTPRQEADKLIGFLEGLHRSWKPEHANSDAWTEESESVTRRPTSTMSHSSQNVENIDQAELERDTVISALIDTGHDLEVETGDVVRYVDLARPSDVLTVQITRGKDDFPNGIVNETRPLAQALLGAVAGDEVVLHLVGSDSKKFQIIEVKRAHSGRAVP